MYVVVPIPQANSLARLRSLVTAVHGTPGIWGERLGERVSLSTRHTDYYASAAILLGLIHPRPDGGFDVTSTGAALLQTPPGSPAEGEFWRSTIARSPIGTELAPDLLSEDGPNRSALAKRIARYAGLARATAERRADCLLSWRAQVYGQLRQR